MFTVKLIRNGVTSVTELSRIEIARKGAESWDEDWRTAKHSNSTSPSIIECYMMETDTNNVLSEYLNVVDRDEEIEDAENKCIGIIHVQEKCSLASAIPEEDCRGFGFVKIFIYKGDQLYVTNRFGSTVEVVK